ncbi:MAG: TonB-dependent receptor [Alloprevotella sp.]|nr:TonB-dependent receptor [Alloprevotella sp.]
MSLLTPVTLSAAESPAEAPQAKAADAKRTITGVVTDGQDGEPLIGATVQVEGDKSAVVATDIDGNFSINVSGRKAILVVSYVGYKTKKVPVDDLSFVEVQMAGDENTLDEVVVVGAGTQKKVSVTGAIASVSGENLRMPATTLSTALAGKMPGIIATQNSGEPGSSASFYIRGISTFGGRTTPLILLDDVEISAADLDYVPAENIESFSILKDASATAIYGARGANGVMIVKTKGGDYNSKTQISIQVQNAFNFVDKFPDFVDGPTFMRLRNEAMEARTPGVTPRYTQQQIDNTASGVNPYVYPNVDWKSVLFKDMAMRQKANISINGGGSKVKYYVSLDVQHENGVLNSKKLYSWNNNINIYNYTFQNNTSIKVTPTTTVTLNMNAQIRQNTGPNVAASTLFNQLYTTSPVMMTPTFPMDENSPLKHVKYGTYEPSPGMFINNPPYAMLNTTFAQKNQNTINTVLKLEQDLGMITKGLSLHAWVNFKNWAQSEYNRSIVPHLYIVDQYDPNDPYGAWTTRIVNTDGSDFIKTSDIAKSSDNTFEFQGDIAWNRTFGQNNLSAMVLYRMREYRNDVLPNRNQGLSGRVTYDYGHRYLAEFNFGYNGTERLAKKDRFGFFPAASIGWVASSEKFFEPLSPVINHLKLRASYGLTGSDDLAGNHFLYIDQIKGDDIANLKWSAGPGSGYYNTAGGPVITYLGMHGIGWEKSRKLDVGLDITLFQDLQITADYFYEHRYDIFLQRKAWPQSLAYGELKPYSNVGKMDNRGFELSASYNRRLTDDLSFSVNGTFTYAKNKLLNADIPYYEEAWVSEATEGIRYGSIFGYVAEGLFKTQEEIDNSPEQQLGSIVMVGDIKYRDINGDGVINSQDQVLLTEQNRTPLINYGFGGTINWKDFDFGFQFTGAAKRKFMMSGMDPFQEGIRTGDKNVLQWIADNYFSEEKGNFDALYPRLGVANTDVANNSVASSYWLRDGSFLRLRNVELGWTFKYGRVFVNGVNLLRFSKFRLWDPELGSWNSYPMQKTVNVGVQIRL